MRSTKVKTPEIAVMVIEDTIDEGSYIDVDVRTMKYKRRLDSTNTLDLKTLEAFMQCLEKAVLRQRVNEAIDSKLYNLRQEAGRRNEARRLRILAVANKEAGVTEGSITAVESSVTYAGMYSGGYRLGEPLWKFFVPGKWEDD
jgi:hypothetical protein